jgi:uncharacterized surface protein with fasciclin (FAS1) repeats
MRRLIALLSVAALSVALAVGGTASAAPERNIVKTAVAAGKFDTLTTLAKEAGLARTLAKGGPYTVFAPTDAAFRKVPKATLKALRANRAQLRAVLLYHVVAGRVTSDEVVELDSAETLNGESVTIRVRRGKVFVNSAKVVTPDVKASNGVIHAINRVLIPPAGR